jgi:hypothetical protein
MNPDTVIYNNVNNKDDNIIFGNKLDENNKINIVNENVIKDFSINQKKKIAERVENLKSKKHFKEIFKIVFTNSGSFTRDTTGIYINFNSLDNSILFKIKDYLDNINLLTKKDIIPLPTKFLPYFSDESLHKDSGIKFSNHEKNILRHIDGGKSQKHSTSFNNLNSINSSSMLDSNSEKSINKEKIIIKPFNLD